MFKSVPGSALQEYALPLILVGLLVIQGVPMLLNSLQTQLFRTHQGAQPANGVAGQNDDSAQLEVRALGLDPNAASVTVPLASGDTANLEGIPVDLAESVETMGASGTTSLLAQQLEKMGMAIDDSDPAKREQAAAVVALARQGKKIARIQGLLEDAARAADGDVNTFRTTMVTLDGQQYSTAELMILISSTHQEYQRLSGTLQELYKPVGNNPFVENPDKSKSVGKEASEFADRFNAVQQTGALENPELRKLVYQLSKDIFTLGLTSAYSASLAYNEEISTNEIAEMTASQISEANATGICQVVGKGKKPHPKCEKANKGSSRDDRKDDD
jgi:hypothetical protein